MSVTYVNWTSRVAIAGRVAEKRRRLHSSNESTAKSKRGRKHSGGSGTPSTRQRGDTTERVTSANKGQRHDDEDHP
jgi:hypothetical protein